MQIQSCHRAVSREGGYGLRNLLSDCSGNVAILAAFLMPVLVGGMGLGAEVGYWYVMKRQIQHAADVSVHAAAVRKRAGDENAVFRDVALRIAREAGYDPSAGTFSLSSPAASGPSAGSPDTVEVVLSENIDRYFSSFFTDQPLQLSGRAVARVMVGSTVCILALSGKDPSAAKALDIKGSADMTLVGCDIASNSLSTSSFHLQGAAKINTDCAYTSGNLDTTGAKATISLKVCDAVRERYFPVADPYKDVAEPSATAPCQNGSIGKQNQTTTVTPTQTVWVDGVSVPGMRYCSLTLKGDVIFEPGVYIVDGDMKSTGGSITATGATFYVRGSVDIAGNAEIKLTAPTSGPLSGLVFFGARNASEMHKINGNSNSFLQGGVYFPAGHVEFTGSSAMTKGCTQVVADTLAFSGNSSIGSECADVGTRDINASGAVRVTE